MLRSDLTYVCIDFETTGLDAEHDEAIQVGIVSFDHTGKVVDTFSSYIKPQKSINELKDMVRVVTGLSIESVANAPAFSEIASSVAQFFHEKTVVVGHNVQFDMRVLKQHMDVQPYSVIDTFPFAQAVMPFTPSYALEVLDKSLKNISNIADIEPSDAAAAGTNGGSAHDALYDAYATQRVFLACIERVKTVVAKYPEVQLYVAASDCALAKIIKVGSEEHTLKGAIPILSKSYTSGKKLLSDEELDKDSFTDKGRYFVGNKSLKSILKALPKENVIYAFSQRHKTQLAKNLLHEIGLTHIDTGGHYIFDKELLRLFFAKARFDQQELYFALKYYLHATLGHSTIDLNSQGDRKIYHALKENQKADVKSVELLTHEYLYEKMRDQSIMPYTTIFFFDQDRWYDTHMKREQKPFDLYSLLQITDSLIYRDSLTNPKKASPREAFHTKLVIFLGVRQTEVAALMKDVSNSTVEVDSIIDNTYFYKSALLINQINEALQQLESTTQHDDFALLQEKRNRFTHIVNSPSSIATKLQGEEVHFVVRPTNTFLDYSEFQQLFDTYQTAFFSVLKKDWPALPIAVDQEGMRIPEIINWPGKEKLDYSAKNIYIFSNNKQMSQEVLVRLHSHKPAQHKVHGENITGGKGKNIFAIKGSSHNIILGGYDFFLQCISQKIAIDKVYTLCINGPLQHIISADLSYYGATTIS